MSASSSLNSHVLVLNAGSSSLKYGLYRIEKSLFLCLLVGGVVEKIGQADSELRHGDKSFTTLIPDHSEALKQVLNLLFKQVNRNEIKLVGHRVVHGGADFSKATVINEKVIRSIEKCVKIAPLHNPACLTGIRAAQSLLKVPQVAVFDTAFHQTIPASAFTYALPHDMCAEHNIRRYGFHGISYHYLTHKTAEILGKSVSTLNCILCHLGNGASMACIQGGVSVDTTMGMTPLEGLVMGTRSGDLDPGLLSFLTSSTGMAPAAIDKVLNKKSGLFGLCGESDLRKVHALAQAGDARAKLAREVYVKRVRKYLGAFLLELGLAPDAIVFSGGGGENDAWIRSRVCEGLSLLETKVDEAKNQDCERGAVTCISTRSSRIKLLVVPTNEDVSIARQAAELVLKSSKL